MSKLADIQKNIQEYILDNNQRGISHIADPSNNSTPQNRLDVYSDGYRARLLEIMQNDFPMLCEYIGEEKFDELASDYIESTPSQHFSIRFYGDKFSEYLKANKLYSELADFEWTLGLSGDRSDIEPATIQIFSTIDNNSWPELKFILHPSVYFRKYSTNAPKIWKALQENKSPPKEKTLEPPQDWLFWRRGIDTYYISLSPADLWVLNNMQQGKNFAELCEGLCEFISEEKVAESIVHKLQSWVPEGLFTEIGVSQG